MQGPVIKHASRIREISKNAQRRSITYTGTQEEMLAVQSVNGIGTTNADLGVITSSRVWQDGGSIWCCELGAEVSCDGSTTATGPDTSYGQKSAQLHGGTISMPLESHPDYRACWNYFLAAAPGVKSVPGWAANAKDCLLSDDDSQKYAWVKSPSEVPSTGNRRWHIVQEPEMPGVESYDLATYTMTVSARFSSFEKACSMVANTLNRVSASPGVSPGISGGNWKCDDATVAWREKYWLATLTWTRSGDSRGWNKKLYS